MDFIERIFGVSPDGGTGATEAAIIAALLFAGLLLASRAKIRMFIARMRWPGRMR